MKSEHRWLTAIVAGVVITFTGWALNQVYKLIIENNSLIRSHISNHNVDHRNLDRELHSRQQKYSGVAEELHRRIDRVEIHSEYHRNNHARHGGQSNHPDNPEQP